MEVSLKVHGVEAMASMLKAKERQFADSLARVVAEAAMNIERNAKSLAPVRTGFLRNSIHAELPGGPMAYVKAYAPYAHYVEYGTRRMHARPYMRPAVEQERARLKGMKLL